MRAASKVIPSARSTQDVPRTFQRALRSGYTVEAEASTLGRGGRRSGTVRLRGSSGRRLYITYEADSKGYRFDKPMVGGHAR